MDENYIASLCRYSDHSDYDFDFRPLKPSPKLKKFVV